MFAALGFVSYGAYAHQWSVGFAPFRQGVPFCLIAITRARRLPPCGHPHALDGAGGIGLPNRFQRALAAARAALARSEIPPRRFRRDDSRAPCCF
jgi:hypothetical protein